MKYVLPLTAVLLAGVTATAGAQDYPMEPVRIVVPVAAGSVTDVTTRAAAQLLSERWGQPVIIDNRGGASGIVGAAECAGSAPDGATVCLIYHNTMSINPQMYTNLPYEVENFEPLTRLYFLTEGFAVSSELGISTIDELRQLALDTPNAVNFGTLGAGSKPDLFRIWLNDELGTEIEGIPYRGGGEVALAVSSNHVQVMNIGLGNFLSMIEDGTVTALAVSGQDRSDLVPDVPTYEEAGIGHYPGVGWWGVAVPAGTPDHIAEEVHAAFVDVFNSDEQRATLAAASLSPSTTSREEFRAFLENDIESARILIEAAEADQIEYEG